MYQTTGDVSATSSQESEGPKRGRRRRLHPDLDVDRRIERVRRDYAVGRSGSEAAHFAGDAARDRTFRIVITSGGAGRRCDMIDGGDLEWLGPTSVAMGRRSEGVASRRRRVTRGG